MGVNPPGGLNLVLWLQRARDVGTVKLKGTAYIGAEKAISTQVNKSRLVPLGCNAPDVGTVKLRKN